MTHNDCKCLLWDQFESRVFPPSPNKRAKLSDQGLSLASDPHVAWSNMVSEMWSSHHLRWDTWKNGYRNPYHLVMTNIAMENGPFIEVYNSLPIKNGDFPWQTVSHKQMVLLEGWSSPLMATWFPRRLPTSACPISARTENKTRAEGFLSEAEKHHRAPRPFDCTFQHWNPPFSDLSWSEDILSKMILGYPLPNVWKMDIHHYCIEILGYPSITHKSISLSEFKRQNELKWISSLPWVRRYSVHKVRTGNHIVMTSWMIFEQNTYLRNSRTACKPESLISSSDVCVCLCTYYAYAFSHNCRTTWMIVVSLGFSWGLSALQRWRTSHSGSWSQAGKTKTNQFEVPRKPK